MKNKRKIIDKYLSQYDPIDAHETNIYYSYKTGHAEVIWFKLDDTYLIRSGFKQFTLKQFFKYVVKLNNLKAFW